MAIVRCNHCGTRQKYDSLVLTEGAELTCPVCGTQIVLSATLKEPVMRGGEAPVPPMPTAPPPTGPVAGAPPETVPPPPAVASVIADVGNVLQEVSAGLDGWSARNRLCGELAVSPYNISLSEDSQVAREGDLSLHSGRGMA